MTYLPPFESKDSVSTADSAIDISKERAEDEGSGVMLRKESRSKSESQRQHSSSFDDAESKLEAEYIRRFLGQLSPLEESRLCELKYGLQAHHKGKLPNDAHLLRFLRARDFDVAKAKEMVLSSLLWRKQHNVDKILEDWTPPSIMTQFFPGCWHQSDKEGRPLFILRLGNLDIKGILRSCGLENVVKFTLSICEQGLMKTAEATKLLGVPISTWTLLVDLEGLSMRHLWRPGVQCLLRIIEIVEEIGKYIDNQYIPDFLGGTCLLSCGPGGHVPKSTYRPIEEFNPDDVDVLSSTYTTAGFSRGYPVEVTVQVTTAGCVLTWDFDILKHECEFIVYYSAKKINESVVPHSPTMLNPVEIVTQAIASTHPLPTLAADPTLVLGPDLTIEEKPVIFQEGDSMQGSHYCQRVGWYVLQWRIPEVAAQHQSAFDFTISQPRGKIMYYTELLNSSDFRGSVASLESCRSSFSSIAQATSSPPTPGSIPREATNSTNCKPSSGQ
ncbi:hypothetical protein WR25_21468 isoform B [Diploscapter pachys]|uniref:CRAL-TRIO domain-containing protein n=1 Tax=Diploscapter pachys TaxID=2018661 RepID=A0A2A2JEL8_9BILA|nr:hypothetical protein WR25_21468 isoform A [Diploscapter pachys]PAV60218.1 hypothetical protein WR25_21468 isoform B [Diploscapter pachys]